MQITEVETFVVANRWPYYGGHYFIFVKLVTDDGITVASRLVGRFREEVVSGLTSFLLLTTRKALSERESEQRIDRYTIHATHGKLLIENVGGAWLIVLTDQFAQVAPGVP